MLPMFLSMTYPTVSCVHSPRSLKVMLCACGAASTRFPVAAAAQGQDTNARRVMHAKLP